METKITPGNYSVHFAESLDAWPPEAALARPQSLANYHWLAAMTRQAQHFILPDGAKLVGLSDMPDYLPLLLRPPFPVTVIEYAVTNNDVEGARSSRRIVVAVSSEANQLPPFPMILDGDPPTAPGVFIYSVCYVDDVRLWSPMTAFSFIPYDTEVRKGGLLAKEVLANLSLTQEQANKQNQLPMRACCLAPELLNEIGGEHIGHMLADTQYELFAYFQMAMALGCSNVGTEVIPASEKLNRARSKSSKRALHNYHVLTIPGGSTSDGKGGAGTPVRSHLRRGHIRRLSGDRITWVNATMVKGGSRGFVTKDYAVTTTPGSQS